jgi:tetratricopeptide (TPR) repeat protein
MRAAWLCLFVLWATPALADRTTDQVARTHFMAGASYYEDQRWEDALREFAEAYRLSRRPALLFNVALCHRHLGHRDEELRTLKQYLDEDPGARDRLDVETRIAELTARPATTPPPTTTPTRIATRAEAPSFWRRPRLYTWVAAGVSGALFVSALGTGIYSKSQLDDLNRRCIGGLCSFPQAGDEIAAGRNAAIATDVLVGLGVGALAVSVVLLFVEGRHAHKTTRVKLGLGPGLAGGVRF